MTDSKTAHGGGLEGRVLMRKRYSSGAALERPYNLALAGIATFW